MRRAMAVAATASGGATTAPSANAAAQLIPGTTTCTTAPTTSVVNATRPMESSRIGLRLALKSTSEVCSAAE